MDPVGTYNSREGWCPHCEGRGAILVEMHFLSDVWAASTPRGPILKATLQVRWNGMTIGDVLQMSVTKALAFSPTTAPSCASCNHSKMLGSAT